MKVIQRFLLPRHIYQSFVQTIFALYGEVEILRVSPFTCKVIPGI